MTFKNKAIIFRILILSYSLALLFFKCGAQNPADNFENAIQLKKGNYWVYKSDIIQLESNVRTSNQNDSIFIREDAVINSRRYYKVENLYGLSEWKRDSAGYIIDEYGNCDFSKNTFDTLFNSNKGLGFMSGVYEQVIVPAGTFLTIVFYLVQKLPTDTISNGKNVNLLPNGYSIVQKKWFAKNVGVIKSVFYYGTTAYEESLLRFKLN